MKLYKREIHPDTRHFKDDDDTAIFTFNRWLVKMLDLEGIVSITEFPTTSFGIKELRISTDGVKASVSFLSRPSLTFFNGTLGIEHNEDNVDALEVGCAPK